ncbi:DNA polymerase III subunit gamma/tau [Metamycoplasma faucium]|uniref:DNA polymerase III subunit gamma/tau n=1 Tax=Metamycoplasma faucium TaxID=56142 RepID=A0ABZ2TLD2_9BACT
MESKYLALYRQYRPNVFDEVQGQEHIVRTLLNIINSQKISHAYLFCGPHGTGKTSVAKIFANTINCSHSNDIYKPCQDCINNIDRNLDIIEIDAASNNGIDDVRDLREKIKHLPTQSKYKIYIIDEVHMLSKGAFNALLKTLEEPPKHVIFILATTDPQKIPLTILSRVQRFNFKRIDKKTIIKHLMNVFKEEKIEYEDNVLDLIASLGAGSLRDTLSIADQVSIFAGNEKIKLSDVEKLFGITNIDNIINIINLATSHSIKDLIQLTTKLVENGMDIERFTIQMINVLKDYLILIKTNAIDLLEYTTLDDLKKINISQDKIYDYISELINILKEVKFSDLPLQSLELGLIKLATLKTNDEEFTNVISSPQINFDQENDKDFIMASELKNDKTKTIAIETKKSKNTNKLDSMFGLSDIANKYDVKTTIVDVNEILEKTNETILKTKTQEFENDEINSSMIDTNETEFDDFEVNDQYNKNTSYVDDEKLHDCIWLTQHEKMNPNITKYKDLDKIALSTINTKLSDEDIKTKMMLKDLKIILSSEKFIVFSSTIDEQIANLNMNAYEPFLIRGVAKLFNRYVHILGITKSQMDNATKWWKDEGKLQKNRKVTEFSDLKKKYEIKEPKNAELEEWAKDAFGDKFNAN